MSLVLPSSCSLNSPGNRNMKFHCRNRETAKLRYASVKPFLAFISGRTTWAEASPSLFTLSPWVRGRAGKAPGAARGWFLHSPVQATGMSQGPAPAGQCIPGFLSTKPNLRPAPHTSPGLEGAQSPGQQCWNTEGGTAHTDISISARSQSGDEGPKGLTRHPQGMPQAQSLPFPFLPTTEINEIPTWLHPQIFKNRERGRGWLAAGVPLPRDSHPPEQAPPPCGLGQDKLVLQGEALHM